MRCRRVKIAHAFASACSRVCDHLSAVELLESRRLLSGPTGATALNDLFAPGDVLISTAARVGDWGYFFERDPSTTTARLWRTDGSPAGTSPTDVTFTVTDGVGPTSLTSLNGQLLFIASDPTLGR